MAKYSKKNRDLAQDSIDELFREREFGDCDFETYADLNDEDEDRWIASYRRQREIDAFTPWYDRY